MKTPPNLLFSGIQFLLATHSNNILKIIQRLGVDIYKIPPVLAILDTHLMARNLLKSVASFTLGSLLTELECSYENSDLHNAGNDATLTLHALLKLVIKDSGSRELESAGRENLERIRAVTQAELHERQRWKPNRTALGFYTTESHDQTISNTLDNKSYQSQLDRTDNADLES